MKLSSLLASVTGVTNSFFFSGFDTTSGAGIGFSTFSKAGLSTTFTVWASLLGSTIFSSCLQSSHTGGAMGSTSFGANSDLGIGFSTSSKTGLFTCSNLTSWLDSAVTTTLFVSSCA